MERRRDPPPPGEARWLGRPVLAALLRALVVVIPLIAGLATSLALSRVVPRPGGGAAALWFVAMFATSTAVVILVERLARRILPLAALLRLSLLFPGPAPSRRRLAGRTGTTTALKDALARARAEGIDDEPTRAAGEILGLVAALSAHDKRTRGHSERVRSFADLVGGELGLGVRDRDLLLWAALLHDIGKLAVAGEILNKEAKLEESEWAEIRRHPEEGARLIEPLSDWLGPWAATIGQHHERFDGAGYPRGVAGEEISLGARIVAVADSYETMTAARPYRRAMSAVAAREELARCAGGQFDPGVVRAFLAISMRRLRWTIGPISLLSQLPVTGWLPRIAEFARTAVVAAGTASALVVGALAAPPAPGTERLADHRVLGRAPSVEPSATVSPSPSATVAPSATPSASTAPAAPQPRTDAPRQTTDPAPRPTPSPKASSPAPAPEPVTFHLASNTTGDTTSTPILPLRSSAPTQTALPNYDTDRDSKAGLVVDRSGEGLSETNAKRYQTWSLSGARTLDGPVTLTFWSALRGFKKNAKGEVAAYLLDCSSSGSSCSTIDQETLTEPAWSSTTSWVSKSISFGDISYTIASGRTLVLRLMVTGASNEPLWFAYDTTAYDSTLVVTES